MQVVHKSSGLGPNLAAPVCHASRNGIKLPVGVVTKNLHVPVQSARKFRPDASRPGSQPVAMAIIGGDSCAFFKCWLLRPGTGRGPRIWVTVPAKWPETARTERRTAVRRVDATSVAVLSFRSDYVLMRMDAASP